LKKENIMDAPVTPISLWAAMMASNSLTWSMSPLESSVFHSSLTTGGFPDFQEARGHGFQCRTNGSSIQECWTGIYRKCTYR
jgi:hypothetical protein